jgi:UDP-N-acetylglucosamine 4,6-dehydratase
MPSPSRSVLAGKSVLCTGATGFFGHAFVRRALQDGAERIVAYSRSESKQAAMRAEIPDARIRWAVGDVRDYDRLYDACEGVDYVAHAAALKRIEVCAENTEEAHKTNVEGTAAVARACIARGVRRATLLSTDKAAAPSTIYGKSKAWAECIWTAANARAIGAGTRLASCRYGNVTSSTGSVIPLWRAQAVTGEITMVDPSMSRFWMPVEDAVDIVLTAFATMRGGEVLIPKCSAATLGQLAVAVAPGCTWRTIRERTAEKLHETLISAEEAAYTYDAGSHLIIEPSVRPWGELAPLPYPKVPAGFEYRSDLARGLEPHELSALVAA